MSKRIRDESGWTMIIAVIVMTLMLSVGLALLSVVDTQQKHSGNERIRESSLNMDEAALYGQGLVLTQRWPITASLAYPSSCTSASAAGNTCPNRDLLAKASAANPALANFTTPDFLADSTWVTKVRDNGGTMSTYYNPAQADATQSGTTAGGSAYTCPGPCTWDANGDHKIWVESTANVRGHPRAVVAQLQLELLTEDVPKMAIQAGHLVDSNNGWHGGTPIVNGDGSPLGLRCDPGDPAAPNLSCADYRTSGSQSQVSPAPTQLGSGNVNLMTAPELARMKQRAKQDGTYYDGTTGPCPTSAQLNAPGGVVFVDGCNGMLYSGTLPTTPCTPPPTSGLNNNCINTPQKPGVLIWHEGHVRFTGNATFVGLLYMANNSDGTGTGGYGPYSDALIQTNGGFGVWGAIAVDGNGGLDLGSNGGQLFYNRNAFSALQSYGTAGLVQNTWRELPPTS